MGGLLSRSRRMENEAGNEGDFLLFRKKYILLLLCVSDLKKFTNTIKEENGDQTPLFASDV